MGNNQKTIIVTGSNKGMGYALVEALAKEGNKWNIIMACRNLELAKQAQSQISSKYPNSRIQAAELDVSNTESVDKFIVELTHKKIEIDILFNNAGIVAQDGEQFNGTLVKKIFGTNFFGTVYLTEKIIPLIRQNGKVIFMGSMAGKYHRVIQNQNEGLLKKWRREDITRQDLFENVSEFIQSVKNNTYQQLGYGKFAYATSKLSVNTFARILGKNQIILDKQIQVYTLCPGRVATQMTPNGSLTIEQGIETPLFLINLPFEINPKYQGQFFQKSQLSSLDYIDP